MLKLWDSSAVARRLRKAQARAQHHGSGNDLYYKIDRYRAIYRHHTKLSAEFYNSTRDLRIDMV